MASDPEDHDLGEVLDRVRRIETKLTKFIESQGVDSGARHPIWLSTNGSIHMQSLETSVKELLALIPPNWPRAVQVIHKGRTILNIYTEEPNYNVKPRSN